MTGREQQATIHQRQSDGLRNRENAHLLFLWQTAPWTQLTAYLRSQKQGLSAAETQVVAAIIEHFANKNKTANKRVNLKGGLPRRQPTTAKPEARGRLSLASYFINRLKTRAAYSKKAAESVAAQILGFKNGEVLRKRLESERKKLSLSDRKRFDEGQWARTATANLTRAYLHSFVAGLRGNGPRG